MEMIDRYLANFFGPAVVDREAFLKLGRHADLELWKFNLTAFALRLSARANAVSKLHGRVTRTLWRDLWPEKQQDDIPLLSITNGVHLPSWQAPEISELCEKYLGPDWLEKLGDINAWNCFDDVPDGEVWRVRQTLKSRLINAIQDRAQQRWTQNGIGTQQVIAMGSLLDPYSLTIAFTRRFTEYKRPYLILSDVERLKRIVTNPLKPVQIVFAGKSHPADYQSKQLLKKVYQTALDKRFQGRIVFVEDYDLNLARELVRGVDVWLNNPRRLQEACGTSGMKAAMNGGLNLSVLDGWWVEAYNEKNGWAIGGSEPLSPPEEDRTDAESLYQLLENEVSSLYYDRDRAGVPHGWIRMVKEAIKTVSPHFGACRMMREYSQAMYLPVSNKKKTMN
jgi:starch phosphorylase